MEYKRKLFTLPEDLVTRLEKELNQSATAALAIKMYLDGKDGTKMLAKLTQDNTETMGELARAVQEMQSLQKKIVNWMNTQGASI